MAFLEYEPHSTLYQYCSIAAMHSILTSGQIWLTDLRSANDPREIMLGYSKTLAALSNYIERSYKNEKLMLLREFRDLSAGYYVNSRMFCACFSLRADLLPMWLAYGDEYRGACIGFRSDAFSHMHARIQRVHYLDAERPLDFDEISKKICKLIIKHSAKGKLHAFIYGADLFNRTVTGLKHQSWAHESEVRVVYAYSNASRNDLPGLLKDFVGERPDGTPIPRVSPMVRVRGAETVNYFSEPFGRYGNGYFDASRAIERIIIGPLSTETEQQVHRRLEDHGFVDVEVIRSECQIRV